MDIRLLGSYAASLSSYLSFPAVRTWRCPAILLALAILPVAGCGGGASAGFTKNGPPAPRDCVKRYNDSPTAISLGSHAYGQGHNSRAAHVFKITDKENELDQSCAVIFNAADSDREYGILGAVEFQFGWDYTTQLKATPDKRAEIQALGAEQANVTLKSDGTLAPLE
jgi:hypothetical protein